MEYANCPSCGAQLGSRFVGDRCYSCSWEDPEVHPQAAATSVPVCPQCGAGLGGVFKGDRCHGCGWEAPKDEDTPPPAEPTPPTEDPRSAAAWPELQ